MDFSECLDCAPSLAATLLLFGVGALLTTLALVARRRLSSSIGLVVVVLALAAAASWNLILVFVFVYPHNHHVIYLSSHRASLVANAAVGIFWFAAQLVVFWRWWRPHERAA